MDANAPIQFAENYQPVLVRTSGTSVVQIHMPGDDSYKAELELVHETSKDQGISFEAAAADMGYEIGSFSVF